MQTSRTLAYVFPTKFYRSHFCAPRVTCSGRHARQMERCFGPAWKYVRRVTAVTQQPVQAVANTEFNGVEESFKRKADTELRKRAVEFGLVAEEHREAFVETPGESVSSGKDPLLDFLEENEEDAALMLSMWTSLRRCCLHASGISESLSLSVRWFLHYLIHMRAIAAAVRFYQRLLALGVQLQKWDVMVLLSNLPYERSTTVTKSQLDAWMQEEHVFPWTSRRVRERRRRGEKDNYTSKQGVNSATRSTTVEERAEFPSNNADTARSTAFLSHSPKTRSSVSMEESVAESDTSIFQVMKRPMSEQPVWVKRWILYEASMGNLDFPQDEAVPVTSAAELGEPDSNELVEFDEDMLCASIEANRIIELTALVKHLMLLQGAWNVSLQEKKIKKVKQKERHHHQQQQYNGRGEGLPAIRPWQPRFATQSRYWAEALHIASVYLESRSALQQSITLPDDLLSTMRHAVVSSGSWKVSLRYLQAAGRHGVKLCEEDYAKFVLMSLEAEPWRKNRVVERFMAFDVVPRFLETTAAGYAIKAIWLAHLCSLKIDRPEDYMELMGEHTKNFPEAIKQSIVFAKLAASHLRIEVGRHRAQAAAQQVLATSVRLGLFSHVGERSHENQDSLLSKRSDISSTGSVPGALLSDFLKDSFMLVCGSISRIFALVPIVVMSQDDSLQFCSFLADTLYGPMGLWGVFSGLYLAEGPISARQDPEKASIAASMALCVLRIALTLCVSHCQFFSQQHNISLLTGKQLTLFLGMVVEALHVVPSHAVSTEELRLCMSVLAWNATRLMKKVGLFLKLNSNSEKIMFGSISMETVESVALMVRILLLLHLHAPGRRFPVAIKLLLCSLLRSESGLGKQVRHCLQQREVRRLDCLLYKQFRSSKTGHIKFSSVPHLRAFSSEDIQRIEATARMHKLVYSVVLHHENNVSAVQHNLLSYLHSMRGDDVFLLVHVALHHLRLRPGTFNMQFFVAVLERLCSGAMDKTNRTSLWLKAVTLYWNAVEHTAGHSISFKSDATSSVSDHVLRNHERNVLSALLLSMMRLSVAVKQKDIGWAWLNCWVSLYQPVERDLCWEMLNIQARSTLREKRALQMCLRLLQDEWKEEKNALAKLPPAPLTELLCKVAVQHADWRVALDNLLQPFVRSLKDGITFALPSVVAISALHIMCRAPINLSNTALRLRAIQGNQWDLQEANGLLLLLVRQRRWHMALQHIKEMLPTLDTTTTNIEERDDSIRFNSTSREQPKIVQAYFLLHGLRACAIGGCGEEAATLYDRVKGLLKEPQLWDVAEKMTPNDHMKHLEELLFSAGDFDGETANLSLVNEENEQLRVIAGQARLYFFRAMTKKSLVSYRRQK